MVKFIKYHLLYLYNDLWSFLAIIMMIVSGFLFFYMGNGFDSSLLRVLEQQNYLIEFENEAFLISNIVLNIWIIGASKEMFSFDEAHIMLINKNKYVKSKILAYLFYYVFMCFLLYGIYQLIVVLLYGIVKFNYLFLIHLIINVSLTHLLIVVISGKNKNILTTMIFIVIYLIINLVLKSNLKYLNYVKFFLPILSLNYSQFGYIHLFLLLWLIYIIGSFKHITDYD